MLAHLDLVGQGFLEFVYPPLCFGCGKGVDSGRVLLCARCQEKIGKDVIRRCRVCAHPLSRPGDTCLACILSRPRFDQALCLGDYAGPLKRAIRAFKFGGNRSLGRLLGELLAHRVYRDLGGIDRVIAVPMTRSRQKDRGFSHTQVLARELARAGGLGRESRVLRRTGRGVPLTARSRLDRQLEILDAYHLEPGVTLRGERVLLVDDVLTTGATSRNLTTLLKERAGARQVFVAVLARTVCQDEA